MASDERTARCPICGFDVPLDTAPLGGRKTGIVCPNCGTPFSHTDPTQSLDKHIVKLLLDHYQIVGTIHLAPEHTRFSDAWESLMEGTRSFIPITDAHVTRHTGESVAEAKFMQIQKNQIRGAVPLSEAN